MAGIRCIEEIIKKDREGFEITVIGDENHPNYNRIMLSNVLQGKTSFDEININDWDWYIQNNVMLLAGEKVVKIDPSLKQVETDKGNTVPYD
ncbi:FAD-dependent oxidoreductase, partial [Pseudomonas sp. 2822-17]|uniref:FAD-dependent oxidoreductase n=1 Tax=Pseudomonas sp. 2822-17 TaxID=1712678 RepID=UPI001C46962D